MNTKLVVDPRGKGKVARDDRKFKHNWFLDRTDDLSAVTDEGSNPALGIKQIQITYPTANQKAQGILGKVALETLNGWDFGITIWPVKGAKDFDIKLLVGGARKLPAKDGQKAQTIRDRNLNDATVAQILSHVWKHLVPKTIEQ